MINVLAHKAMLAAYGEGKHYVSSAHVRSAAKDTPSARPIHSPMAWIGVAAMGVVAALIYWYLNR